MKNRILNSSASYGLSSNAKLIGLSKFSWLNCQVKPKGSIKGIEEFPPKDPEVPKLGNNTNSKLELTCTTNIKKIRSENIDNVIIGTLNINSLSYKFDDLKILISGMFDI